MISIIIPAYNEEKRIIPTLKEIIAYFLHTRDFEIVIVNDGSTDNTANVIREYIQEYNQKNIRLLDRKINKGKGKSVQEGILAAHGDPILYTDADLSTPIREYEKLKKYLGDYDVIIGSRALPESQILVWQPWYRVFMGRCFNKIVRFLAVQKIHDTQCGFKLFTGEAARQLFSKQCLERFGFDVEILFLAQKRGYRIKEVPVEWINHSATKVRPIYDALQMFLDLLCIRWWWVMGKYK